VVYSSYGTTEKIVSLIGLGSGGIADSEDITHVSEILNIAADAGINYFDISSVINDKNLLKKYRQFFAEMNKNGCPFCVSLDCSSVVEREAQGCCSESLHESLMSVVDSLGLEKIDFLKCDCQLDSTLHKNLNESGLVDYQLAVADELRICDCSENNFAGINLNCSKENLGTLLNTVPDFEKNNLGLSLCGNSVLMKSINQLPEEVDHNIFMKEIYELFFSQKSIDISVVDFREASEIMNALDAVNHLEDFSEDELAVMYSHVVDILKS
jgi:hypothetical protein